MKKRYYIFILLGLLTFLIYPKVNALTDDNKYLALGIGDVEAYGKVEKYSSDVDIDVSTSSVNFGEVLTNFGTNITRQFTVTNIGTVTVNLTMSTPTSSGPFGTYSFDNSIVLIPGQSYEVTVIANSSSAFANVPNTYNGTYVITATETNGTRTDTASVSASVTVRQRTLEISSSDTSVDFGEVTTNFSQNVVRTVIITNTGETSVNLSITNPTGDGPFGVVSFENNHLLAPGDEYEVNLVANSSSAFANVPNTYNGTYVITATETNGTRADTIDIGASVVVREKILEVSSTFDFIDFEEVYAEFEETVERTFILSNSGETAVTLTMIAPTEDGPFGTAVFENNYLLEPGETYEVTIIADKNSEFAAIPGTYEGTYVITASEVDGTRTDTVNVDVSIVVSPKPTTNILYTTHVQDVGWQDYVSNGAMAGTSGRSLRLEGIKIVLANQDHVGNIEYRTHIQNIGWESEFKQNNDMSGTEGLSYRLEAIEIKLTGEIADYYDVYYRVHAQNFGWLGWARNGERSGTAGYAYRLEGIEIKLVPKGQSVDGYGKEVIFYDKSTGELIPISDDALVSYTTHIQNIGWQNYVADGKMAGTEGKSLRLEGIKIKLLNQPYEGDIEYRTHIQNIGWENEFKKNDGFSGTEGKALRLEAIEIKLTGEMAEYYDVYYRVHAQNFGWLGWAKNGEQAGTAGYAYRLEGIEILVLPKGETPTGFGLGQFRFYEK